jgi:hypothetical protein
MLKAGRRKKSANAEAEVLEEDVHVVPWWEIGMRLFPFGRPFAADGQSEVAGETYALGERGERAPAPRVV